MIEFKNLQNRFLIHQALVAAAAANVFNSPNFLLNSQNENLEINTSPSAYTASSSSVSSSPIFNYSPTTESSAKCTKRKLASPSESVPFAKRTNSSRSSSSFLISDILGLDNHKPDENAEEINITNNLKAQYQTHLQQSYYSALAQSELFRFITNSKLEVKHAEKRELSPIPRVNTPPLSKPSKCSTGILSSLEQLTRDQFQDDFNFDNIRSVKKHLVVKQEVNNDENKTAGLKVDKKPDLQKETSLLPAWVYCTRYSDRPSAGPRHRKKSSKANKNINSASKAISSAQRDPKNPTEALKNSSSSSSSNSSFSFSPQLSSINKKLDSDGNSTAENESKFFYENKPENTENNEEELCYDSDDSNMSMSKRPRTAFTSSQLNRLKNEFEKCKYLTGEKRQCLANELKLNESQIKIWFQNKRAKIKKSSGVKNNLAIQLMAQGLYNHGSDNQ